MRLATSRFKMIYAVAGFCLAAEMVAAQSALPISASAQVGVIAEGWAALAKGDLSGADTAARNAMKEAPRSAAALALAVEVEIVGTGPGAGLDSYERWLGTRKVEAPYVLRRIATAILQTAVRQRNTGAARVEALKFLVADGDPMAVATLSTAAENAASDSMFLAAFGDDRAVQTLLADLPASSDKIRIIRALADSRSATAVPALVGLLATGRDDERSAAADALGRLGAQEAVGPLTAQLDHANFSVRFAAAAALSRLGNAGGLPFLDPLLSSEHSAIRLSAADALSVMQGTAWLQVARALTSDPDPSIRLGAARLVASHDRELAESVLFALGTSDNLAIREEAARIFAERVANDFSALRLLLRSPDRVTSVRAAGRLLELTR